MKKGISLVIFGLLCMSFMPGLASAGPFDGIIAGIQEGGKGVYELFRPLLEGIIGEAENGETFLAKILFLVIIFTVLFVALGNIDFFSERVWPLWLVSIAAAILSIRWFSSEFVSTVILPYSALGIAVSAGLPFALYFLIVKEFKVTLARKTSWAFFAVVFIGLYFSRWDELGNFGFIYLVTAVVALLMIPFDAQFQKARVKSQIEKIHTVQTKKRAKLLMDELDKTDEDFAKRAEKYQGVYTNHTGRAGWEKDRESIMKRITELSV